MGRRFLFQSPYFIFHWSSSVFGGAVCVNRIEEVVLLDGSGSIGAPSYEEARAFLSASLSVLSSCRKFRGCWMETRLLLYSPLVNLTSLVVFSLGVDSGLTNFVPILQQAANQPYANCYSGISDSTQLSRVRGKLTSVSSTAPVQVR